MNDIQVSVVSGTFNRLKHLKKMVSSVRKSIAGITYEIILVDGGSTDGTIKWCKDQQDIRLIEQGKLVGAVKAFNAGCVAAQGQYVAILNDDIEVVAKTLRNAYEYLENHPDAMQVAFMNKPTKQAAEPRSPYSHSYGYLYGQCCMTRRWIGDHVNWWGHTGLHTYGGDSRLGMRIWECGYRVVPLDSCSVTDHVVEDKMRKDRRKLLRPNPRGPHKDTEAYRSIWDHRLPHTSRWIEAPSYRLLQKAEAGRLRTLRFRHLRAGTMRMAQLRAFREFGPSEHINQAKLVADHGIKEFQSIARKRIREFKPDLVMFQAHGAGNIMPETIRELRGEFPQMYFVNFDGDMHNPLRKFHFDIAKSVHLQLLISSDLYQQYINHGAYNVSWWSTATEDAFISAGNSRPVPAKMNGPDVVSLMNRTPPEVFPNAHRRIESVVRLSKSKVGFKLYGTGWTRDGLTMSGITYNDDKASAELYRTARMALCISQSRDLYGYSSNRLFFAGAVGCTPLLDEFRGMQQMGFVDGKTVISFRTMDEMIRKAEYYASHPNECESIGKRCRELVLERHTYKPRIMALLAYLDGIGVP